jgi:hypothetical protein
MLQVGPGGVPAADTPVATARPVAQRPDRVRPTDRLEYFFPRLPDWMRVAVEFRPGGALAETAFPQHGQHPTNVTHIT